MSMCSISNWNLEVLVFEERGELKNPQKTSHSKGEYQRQTLPTHDVRSSPGLKPVTHTYRWEASAVANVPPLLHVPCVSEE